jgi:hypothetical protein
MPISGPGEVVVKIHTVSLNYGDTEVITALYNNHKTSDAEKKRGGGGVVICGNDSGEFIGSS